MKHYFKHFANTTAWVLLGIGLVAGALTLPKSEAPTQSLGASPAVFVKIGDGKCSGFVVKGSDNKPYLWTAAHCTDGAGEVDVVAGINVGGRELPFTFKAYVIAEFDRLALGDLDIDAAVAVIDAPIEAFQVVAFAQRKEAAVGDEIYHVGWFLGKFRSYSCGHVGWIGSTLDGTDLLAQPGSSGGPVFNKYGDIVGILVAMRGTIFSNKQQLYVPIRVIRVAAKVAGLDYAL